MENTSTRYTPITKKALEAEGWTNWKVVEHRGNDYVESDSEYFNKGSFKLKLVGGTGTIIIRGQESSSFRTMPRLNEFIRKNLETRMEYLRMDLAQLEEELKKF